MSNYLVISTIFMAMFAFWLVLSLANHSMSVLSVISGMFISAFTSIMCWKFKIINRESCLLFMQTNFYRHIYVHMLNVSKDIVTITIGRYRRTYHSDAIVDYVFIDKSLGSEMALCCWLMTSTPGVICVSMRTSYVMVHSLRPECMSLASMYKITSKIKEVYDDNLV